MGLYMIVDGDDRLWRLTARRNREGARAQFLVKSYGYSYGKATIVVLLSVYGRSTACPKLK